MLVRDKQGLKFQKPDWAHKTVVCIASGPSLTKEDCELVRASGHPVAVTNTTFRLVPWADVIFAMDLAWWKQYHEEVKATCEGRRVSTSHAARAYGAESLYGCYWYPSALNSGAGVINLAISSGASKIVMLGYDCQRTNGMSHWHGDHPQNMGNAASLKRWPKHFEHVLKDATKADCKVINASRQTALTCFERMSLEDALR